MKIVQIALITVTALGAGMTASYADSPTNRQQAENLWIATGNPTFGRLAGLTDAQINAAQHMPPAQVDLPSQD